LLHYLKDEAEREIPAWRMIAAREDALRARAEGWRTNLGAGEVMAGRSTVGGGSLPEETLPTWLLALRVPQPNRFLAALRAQPLAVIARVEDERVLLDPRTVLPEQEDRLLAGVRAAIELSGREGKRA
jgi:L-seryl-tRNA(Ser) seleniumtransferase